jgi:hypothetical protein
MGKLLSMFVDYFETPTPEQVQANWDTLQEFNTFGPLALLSIENSQYCFNFYELSIISFESEISNDQTYSLAA